jgi:hypothetical protein
MVRLLPAKIGDPAIRACVVTRVEEVDEQYEVH